MKWKSIDLDLWKPGLEIPNEFILGSTKNIRILHSYFDSPDRFSNEINIKGSKHVSEAIDRLKSEGFEVELVFTKNVPSNQMRFIQAQCDILIDQLIYGAWGSTTVEGLALGKPVICYIREEWMDFFLKTFPEYTKLPVINATTESIYSVLRKLLLDPSELRSYGESSREFSLKHFDPSSNAKDLAALLLSF